MLSHDINKRKARFEDRGDSVSPEEKRPRSDSDMSPFLSPSFGGGHFIQSNLTSETRRKLELLEARICGSYQEVWLF